MRGVLLCILLAVASCSGARRNSPGPLDGAGGGAGPRVLVHVDARVLVFGVELARTEEEHARGLMYRDHLAADRGMLFLFDEPKQQSFWMKNTLIPLDMLFIGSDRRIVGVVENAQPRTLEPRQVDADSQYVLELNGGTCARSGIRTGALVEFLGF